MPDGELGGPNEEPLIWDRRWLQISGVQIDPVRRTSTISKQLEARPRRIGMGDAP